MLRQTIVQGIYALQLDFMWSDCVVLQVRGKMSCLLINDIDAGLGHFANTQVRNNIMAKADMPLISSKGSLAAAEANNLVASKHRTHLASTGVIA